MRYFLLSFFAAVVVNVFGQSTDVPLNSSIYDIVDRWDVKSEKPFFSTVKPISRESIARFSKYQTENVSAVSTQDLRTVRLETREYQDTLWQENKVNRRFYSYPSDFISVSQKDFDFHLNPIIALSAGKESASGDLVFTNYRGLEMRGTIDKKVSFYTLLTENQARYASYVRHVIDSTLNVPYEGFWKQYGDTGVDFLRAQAYIDFNMSKHIAMQFGYGKHFVGNGERSLILSDFSNNYPYLRLQTQIWKFQYTNLFAQLTAETYGGTFGLLGTGSFPKKHLALHHLEMNITDNFSLGLFESVIYGKPDSLGNNGLKVEYLNPIIFYRALEQQDGSADNAILGLDFKWNVWKTASIYGQLVIDELIVSKAFSGDGYWENKQAFQLGAKYFDAFGIKNLKLQAEWNQVRPYTYAHQSNYTSYTHYNQALAHPLGANFREFLFSGTYRISPKLTATGDLLLAKYGNDIGKFSQGRDILKSYNLRDMSVLTGVDLFQGDETDLLLIHGKVSYQWFHNCFTSVDFTYRSESSESGKVESTTSVFSFSVGYNFPSRSYLF